MNDKKIIDSEEVKPLRPSIIAGVGFLVSLLFSVFFAISNNYNIAEFSVLVVFGGGFSICIWALFRTLNNVKRQGDII